MTKKRLFSILLFTFFIGLYGQTIVVNEQFKSKDYPVGYNFLPNKNRIVIQKGPLFYESSNKLLNFIYSYDHEGFRELLSDKGDLMNCIFSPTENSFSIARFSISNPYGDQYKIVVDGVSSPFFNTKDAFPYFNDEYMFGIVNEKQKMNFDFKKDAIYLTKKDIKTGVNSKTLLKKPDLARITGDSFTKYANDVTFSVRTNDSNFGIITKSISKEYQSSTLYRSVYNFEGELMADSKYEIKIKSEYLMYSNNGGGFINTNSETGDTYISDLAINNFVVDKNSDDVYVYGLLGEEAKSSNNIMNKPTGFYVFKFDKLGNKMWESIQMVDDKTHFNTNQNITNIKLTVSVRNNEILLYLNSSLKNEGYMHYVVLNKVTGSVAKKNKIVFESNFQSEKDNTEKNFIPFMPYKVKGFENKSVDLECIIANEINPEFSKYMALNQSKGMLFFKTYFAKNGIWFIESDNALYYKILFFKD